MESRCGLTRRRPCLSFSLAAKATGYVAAEPLRGDSAHPRVSVCRHPEDCRLSAERPLSSPSSGLPSLRASCSAPHPRLRAACILALLTALLTSPVARGAASANRAETSPSGQSRHPFLDEAREFEADAEWKPRGRAPLSVADVAEAAIQTLDRLTADLKHSPLAHDIDQDEEEKLDRVDTRLSEGDQMLKHIGCFRLAERHLAENRATYKDLLEKFSPQKGMRQDEMLRLMFHGAWVACYQTFETPDDVQRLTRGHLSPQEQLAALYRGPTTPLRFSKKQHSFAEQSIRKFAVSTLARAQSRRKPRRLVALKTASERTGRQADGIALEPRGHQRRAGLRLRGRHRNSSVPCLHVCLPKVDEEAKVFGRQRPRKGAKDCASGSAKR